MAETAHHTCSFVAASELDRNSNATPFFFHLPTSAVFSFKSACFIPVGCDLSAHHEMLRLSIFPLFVEKVIPPKQRLLI